MIGYLVGGAVLAGLVWLGTGIRKIGAVSEGALIGDRAGAALLLIDLQTVFWDHGPYPEPQKAGALAAIEAEVAAARDRGEPVIALRQEWSIGSTKAVARLAMKGQAVEGTPGVELAAPFADLADHALVKRVQDGFETGELDRLLASLDIGALRICGLDFNYCVQKTALAARNRGYAVSIAKGATLASTPTAQAEERLAGAGVVLGLG